VSLELPGAGRAASLGDVIATVESVKAASEIHAPVSGKVVTSNAEAAEEPGRIKTDPSGTWLFKLTPSNSADVDALMTPAAYKESIGE
jgi:glycine cleavage system H protein